MSQLPPLEERTYGAAIVDMLRHVGDCAECRDAKCSKCSLVGFEHADVDACIAASTKTKIPSEERDLSDPTTKLCPRGDELRKAAHEARVSTPAERLIAYWSLESVDVPQDDRWDCARGAEWVRSDPARARAMLEQIEARKESKLEDVDEEVQVLRASFLKGFRSVCPGPGRPPTEEELAARRAAVERIVSLISERFVRRFRGVLPHPTAVEAFRRGHDLAVASTDLVALADGIESVRLRKGVLWGQAAPRGTEPGDPGAQAEELRKLARWAAERFAETVQESG